MGSGVIFVGPGRHSPADDAVSRRSRCAQRFDRGHRPRSRYRKWNRRRTQEPGQIQLLHGESGRSFQPVQNFRRGRRPRKRPSRSRGEHGICAGARRRCDARRGISPGRSAWGRTARHFAAQAISGRGLPAPHEKGHGVTAVAALTERMVLGTLRDDLPFAILAPAGNFVVFNFGLRNVIDTGQMSYPQYLLPAIIVQVMLLGALTTVDRAARDHGSDFGIRLRTLPISAVVPPAARMLNCVSRGALALLAALAVGYVFGFRMAGGFLYTAAFAFLVLTLTLAVLLGGAA